MKTSLLGRASALLIAGVLIAGCGSSSSDSKSTSTPSGSGGGSGSGSVVNDAVTRCLGAADKISDANTKAAAVKACNAVKSGNVSGLKKAIHTQCLTAANQAPNGTAKQIALDACKKLQ